MAEAAAWTGGGRAGHGGGLGKVVVDHDEIVIVHTEKFMCVKREIHGALLPQARGNGQE